MLITWFDLRPPIILLVLYMTSLIYTVVYIKTITQNGKTSNKNR